MNIEAIQTRRKYKKDKPEEISRKWCEIIEAGTSLPLPGKNNKQPWKFIASWRQQQKELLTDGGWDQAKSGEALLIKSAYGPLDAENTLRIMREAPILIICLKHIAGKSPFESLASRRRFTEIRRPMSIGCAASD